MSRPPKPNLAAIVASAGPPARDARKDARKTAPRASADILTLDLPASAGARPNATLKQRARQMSVYLEPAVYEQLRELAHVERAKMHGLMLEALDLLFRQRGARSIAQITGTEKV